MSKPRAQTRRAGALSAEAILARLGLRRTPVRLGVLRCLIDADRALTAQQVQEQLPADTDGVTVYRTLTTLAQRGVVHRVRSGERAVLYAMGEDAGDRPQHRHPHFVCDDCGRLECLESARVPGDLARRVKVGKDYELTYAEVVVHGRCPQCRQ